MIMKSYRFAQIVALLIGLFTFGLAQQSDFEIKERFKTTYDALRRDIDSAQTKQQIEQIPDRIKSLESEFAQHGVLISGAFYPGTLESMIRDLQDQYVLAQNKATTIQTQGTRLTELEGQLVILNTEIETLNTERQELMTKLRSTTNSLAEQKDLVRRLNANLQSKDRLVSAMVDSIFLPYGKNMDALSEVQKDALGKKLEKASIITRIAGIAQDNVNFLNATKLEAKDYGVLVNQYEQFRNRWIGLRERINSALLASSAITVTKGKKRQPVKPPTPEDPGAQVDVAMAEWRIRLDASFWSGLMNEFTSRGVLVQPFSDAKSFSATIRSYVDSAKTSGMDTKIFVDEVWILRIDKDWRNALESESMLGKVEYGSLDKAVSQLHKDKFDWKIVFWLVNVAAIVLVGWWFLTRKQKNNSQPQTTATATK